MDLTSFRARVLPRRHLTDAPHWVMHDIGILSIDLPLLLLLHLQQQRSVDVGQDTTECDRGPDESVEFLVPTDGELQVAGGDALDFEVLSCVASEFEDFSSQVLQDRGDIYGS